MKKTNKILAIILAILMIISIVPITSGAATYSGTCGDNADWTYDSSTYTLTISGTGDMYDYKYNNRPWESYKSKIKNVVVNDDITKIGAYAFYSFSKVESIVIPESISAIGKCAFNGCEKLTSITIPKGVTSISEDPFYRCENLTDIIVDSENQYYSSDEYGVLFNKDKTVLIQYPIGNTRTSYIVPEGVTTISDSAFYNCITLTSITLPNGVKAIEDYAFDCCDGLTSIVIPDGVTTIGSWAFASCDNLESITIPESVTTISGNALTYNTTIVYYGGTANQWKQLLANNPASEGTYLKELMVFCADQTVIPSGTCGDNLTWTYDVVTGTLTISGTGKMDDFETDHFDMNDSPWGIYSNSIKKIVIEDGVTSIGDYALYRCDNLKTIYYNGTQSQWDKVSFGIDNDPLLNAGIHYNSTETHQPNYTLVVTAPTCTEQGYTTYNCYCGGHYVDNYVYKLGHTDNDNNEYCEICNKYIYIATGACGNNLTWGFNESTDTLIISGTGSMPDYYVSAPNIAPWKSYQYKIKKIIINDGVTKIGNYAFRDCTNLTSVTIPYSVNSVYINAFYYCSNLTDVYYCGTEEQWKYIFILSYNDPLLNATIHYNSTGADTHPYKPVITPPTCTEQGYTTYTCACGYSNGVDNYVDSLGHHHTLEITIPATHLTEGLMTFTCVCGDTYTEVIEKISEHNHEAVITTPTCTEQGYKTYTCECGDSYVDDYVNALGHTPANAVEENYVAPTCTENGNKDVVVYCSVCDGEISRETETLDATGHTDNDGDGYCDADNALLDPSVECDHACHKEGITGFFWRISNFFNMLFRSNKYCSCGVAHY